LHVSEVEMCAASVAQAYFAVGRPSRALPPAQAKHTGHCEPSGSVTVPVPPTRFGPTAPHAGAMTTGGRGAFPVQRKVGPLVPGPSMPGRPVPGMPRALQAKAPANAQGSVGGSDGGGRTMADSVAIDPVRLSARTPGIRLPSDVQARMEAVFGVPFSDVRVHVGPQAQSLGALAVTMGSSIFVAPGHYNPHSASGLRL
jgi:hypothetical protein